VWRGLQALMSPRRRNRLTRGGWATCAEVGPRRTRSGVGARAGPRAFEARILVDFGYSATPVLFGLLLYALAVPRSTPSIAAPLEPLSAWSLWCSGPRSLMRSPRVPPSRAQTWIVKSRLRAFLGSEFGRVLPLAVCRATGVVFALTWCSCFSPMWTSVLAGFPVASDSALSSAISSFQAFAVGTVAFPVAAGFSNRVRDLNQRGFMRAILIMEVGELPLRLAWSRPFPLLGSL